MLRLAAGGLALCVALQALALPAQRAFGRAHYHLAPALLVPGPTADRTAVGPEEAHDEHEHEHDDEAQGHHHAGALHHDHDPGDLGVVYLAEDGGTSPLGQAPTLAQGGHDLDGLIPRGEPLAAAQAGNRPPGAGPARFASNVTDPLERPPRR